MMLAGQTPTKREIGVLPPQPDSLPSFSLRSREPAGRHVRVKAHLRRPESE